MEAGFEKILEVLREYERRLRDLRETFLANLAMISEIPAPTFHEQRRMEFLINRFTEYGLHNCSTDEVGNAFGILPGSDGEKTIVAVAHLDTNFDATVDHAITVETERAVGPGVGDNGLGLAVLATLPLVMDHLEIKLTNDLILMGSARSLGRGNIEGLRFFLDNTNVPITHGVCIEGVKLGRISYSSIGMMRCEISYTVPEEYDWSQFGAVGSIVVINEVINRVLEIPLPRRPRTSVVLGSIEGGTAFDKLAKTAVLRFEIRSESDDMVRNLRDQIEYIVAEVSSNTGAEVTFDVFAQRRPGGIRFSHPLATHAREIMRALEIKPRISPSTSELSAFIDKQIPALTLGLSDGENMNERGETIIIEPMFKGVVQLLGLLLAIDKGYCNEPK